MLTETQSKPDAGREYRKLPSVDALLKMPVVEALMDEHGSTQVTAALRLLLEEARLAIAGGGCAPDADSWPLAIAARVEAQAALSLRPVINATGVIIHTNAHIFFFFVIRTCSHTVSSNRPNTSILLFPAS